MRCGLQTLLGYGVSGWRVSQPEQKQRFLPLCPDFVIELRSPTDSLTLVQAKMREYIENGSRLGWLLNPEAREVLHLPSREGCRACG